MARPLGILPIRVSPGADVGALLLVILAALVSALRALYGLVLVRAIAQVRLNAMFRRRNQLMMNARPFCFRGSAPCMPS